MKAVITGIVAALFFSTASASALLPTAQIGDTYEITLTKVSAQHGSNGSSGSSDDKDTIIERVIGVRADGLELEYDLPVTTAAERASNWQFPARILKPSNGPAQLLNSPELEARLDRWLNAAKLSRAACGHWIFTWNAFRIECDPQSVIKTIEAFDLRSADVRDGASYREPGTHSTGTLSKKILGAEGATFALEFPVDSDAVHRARAEADVATGEILRKPVTLDVALAERTKESVAGTTSVTFETDASGIVYRRTKVTKLEIKSPAGQLDTQTVTETLERRRVSKGR